MIIIFPNYNAMQAYLDLLRHVLHRGKEKKDRTKVGTISVFGYQSRYDLTQGFPLLTTKQMNYKSIFYELLWFIRGDTNIRYLVEHDVHIWDEWPYANYRASEDYANETQAGFIEKIRTDDGFAKKWGNLGPVYGKLWRDFHGVDQLLKLVDQLQSDPNSRRLIISAWDPSLIGKSLLPPCHCFMQFYVNDGFLSCQLYQRSADLFLGVPFNIASYSLLVHMLAMVCHLKVGEFVHTIGDAHIYLNHLDQVKEQLTREPYPLPTLRIGRSVDAITDFVYEDFILEGYRHHPRIAAPVAV